ncbi:MAG: iron-containing alcohol dehydrogenase [Lentisphaerae bacterium]|nr:iron-containing alcohol dehydrogenase [Lentisphaerota bacterium]
MRTIALMQPPRIVIGEQAAEACVAGALRRGHRRIFVVTSPPLRALVAPVAAAFREGGAEVAVHDAIAVEPTVRMLDEARAAARSFRPDAVIGIGGGSALDAAKFVAALARETRPVGEFFGPDKLPPRQVGLVCLPTTSGTGSYPWLGPFAEAAEPADLRKPGTSSFTPPPLPA